MSKNAGWILHRGVHSVHIGVLSAVTLTHRGRPEPESGTPVNMENRLHRDNGEGVAATPPPYPLEASAKFIGCMPPFFRALILLTSAATARETACWLARCSASG